MATSHKGEQGNVKDPAHDGRLKENREAGRTKGTTPGSAARQQGETAGSHGGSGTDGKTSESHAGKHQEAVSHAAPSHKDESSDLKSREYRDEQGNVHHHTHSYQDQHKG
jgi:hypothetical protein